MWQRGPGASAAAVELTAALLLATAVSDALGYAGVSFYLLVLSVPLTAIAGLVCFGHVVDAVNGGRVDILGRFQAALSAVLVAAVVVGAAVREPSVPADSIPPEASAALALGLGILIVQTLLALVPLRRERPQ